MSGQQTGFGGPLGSRDAIGEDWSRFVCADDEDYGEQRSSVAVVLGTDLTLVLVPPLPWCSCLPYLGSRTLLRHDG